MILSNPKFWACVGGAAIGIISQGSGFAIPFLLLGAMAVLGLVPLLLVNWDSGPRSSAVFKEEPEGEMVPAK